MQRQKKKKIHFDISAWVVVSALVVLAAILGMMILMQFQQRKNQAETLFIEKGATLIQSFEAGTRNRQDRETDIFYLQKLLMETAQQPDIDYMIVTDSDGQILADSDPSMLGRPYGLDLDIKKITGNREIHWRQTANPEGADTFEIYRKLSPNRDQEAADQRPWMVFVGFNMDKIEKAARENTFRTVMAALVLVLIGGLAIISLFLVQAYRLTRASLSRMTVFSEALVKHMPIGLIAVERHGRITACNEQAQGLFAGSCSEAVGQESDRLLPAPFLKLLGKVDETNRLVEEDIAVSSEKDGTQMWAVVVATFTDEDAPEGKIILARNVTAIRQMEKEVVRSRHLNALGSLAAGVAHEIRNPLSSIKGFAVYFRQKMSGNREDEETADIMIEETERLNRVISQLIEFARPMELKKELIGMTDLVRHAVRLVDVDAKKNGIEIDIRADADLPKTALDQDKIKQVLLNIFLNALSAMPDGGRLTVTITERGKLMEVTVSDTGTGIREEDLPRIYDPYFTSKPAGSGLGLAVVQKIMDAHEGVVQIDGKEEHGTKVTLRFPLPAKEKEEK